MSEQPNERRAAAGILRRADGAVFVQQRQPGQTFAGFWEFPGGKIRPSESASAAARRELLEETGVRAGTMHPWVLRRRRYDPRRDGRSGKISVHFFIAEDWRGEPCGREGQACRWSLPHDLPAPMLPANEPIAKWLGLPPMCVITAAEIFGEKRSLEIVEDALESGVRFVQLRDKSMPPGTRRAFARRIAGLCTRHGALLAVNRDPGDKPPIQANGVHLSGAVLAACRVRPRAMWAGASCHSIADLKKAAALGLDYAFLSPVRKTPSHPDATPLGWRAFARLARDTGIPVFALGGMAPSSLPSAFRHNAHGIALVRGAADGSKQAQ